MKLVHVLLYNIHTDYIKFVRVFIMRVSITHINFKYLYIYI